MRDDNATTVTSQLKVTIFGGLLEQADYKNLDGIGSPRNAVSGSQ